MTDSYMLIGPRDRISKREIAEIVRTNDCKDWIIAKETGKSGYEHWQIRLTTSNPDFFERVKELEPSFKIIKAQQPSSDYERKEGRFWTSRDTQEILIQRFGTMKPEQAKVLRVLDKSGDRDIVVWYDTKGNIGKSWMIGHLWEIGKAHVCQGQDSVKGMIQDVASDYIKHGWRPYLVLDIPRTWKWTKDMYCAIERIKDGLIKDTRYEAQTINIKGVKILVTCNTLPKLDNLSLDRWVIIEHTRTTPPLS